MKKLETTIGVLVVAVLGILLLSQRPKAAASQAPEKRTVQRPQQQKLPPDSDVEWSAVVEWMERVCPNQIKFLKDNGMDKPAARRVKQLMTEQFRQINSVSDRPLRDGMERKARAQDNIFGVLLQLRAAKQQRDPVIQQSNERLLQQCVADLADAEVAIRWARIAQLKNEIDNMTIPQKRSQWIASVTKREMNQADAPPGRGTNGEIYLSPERNDRGK